MPITNKMFHSHDPHPVKRPCRVKLIAGLLSNEEPLFRSARSALEKRFGKVDFESDILDFTHTDYYREEFGPGLKRMFFSFGRLIGLDGAYKIKLFTGALEKKFSVAGRRSVNIDPGYVDLGKLVLFTTKDHSHRIYLGRGIYAEVTLRYERGEYLSMPWTYPDYRTKEYTDFFTRVRSLYRGQTRNP